MTAPTRARRKLTARQLGQQFGRSPRTIRRIIAEPREDFLDRAQQRREQIRELRTTGISMRAIAAEMGCSVGTVHRALKDDLRAFNPQVQEQDLAPQAAAQNEAAWQPPLPFAN